MSDAWDEIQAIKSKRNSLRERLEKRKKERQDILGASNASTTAVPTTTANPTLLPQSEVKTESNESPTAVETGLY